MVIEYRFPHTHSVYAIAQDESAFSGPPHSHADGQLIYAKSGVVIVTTASGTWIAPPNRAIWIPSMVSHTTRSYGAVKFRSLFIRPYATGRLPDIAGVVEVSNLLRELILRLVELNDQSFTQFTEMLSNLALEELTFLPTEPFNLPMPAEPRLQALCLKIQQTPDINLPLETAASSVGMSRRSFMRHFEQATGMTFGRWHQQARLLAALPAIAEGKTILSVALDCGYQSVSAFTNAFKRNFGHRPSDYFMQ
ncbi:AraC family transcriptional regulator [Paenochrobactrum pullorum]|uniref:AraC family transcriptional regulator n=1 Tax=Paenochrobactrum pullorum TaxID=1324351 RepID=UPI0035BBC06C